MPAALNAIFKPRALSQQSLSSFWSITETPDPDPDPVPQPDPAPFPSGSYPIPLIGASITGDIDIFYYDTTPSYIEVCISLGLRERKDPINVQAITLNSIVNKRFH